MAWITLPRTQVDVEAWTPQGRYWHDTLMGDLKTIQTSKTTHAPYGTWAMTFTMREDQDGSWADKLPYRTHVVIRAGLGAGQPPILMRGLVDMPGQTMQLPGAPQGPQREVTVSGRDFGAILADWQILYLWGIDPMATFLQANMGGADLLAAQLGLSTGEQNPATLLTAFCQKLVNGTAIAGLQSTMPSIPAIQPQITLPSAYQVNFLSVQPWQGAYSNFIDYFASPPWGENFVFDAPDAPQLIVRQTPYKSYTSGQYPLPYSGPTGFFSDVMVPAGQVTAHDLTINSAQQLYTYYATTPDLASSLAQSYAEFFYVTATGQTQQHHTQAQVVGGNPFYDVTKAKLWGIRPLQLTTPWVSTVQSALTQAQTTVAKLNTWLVDVYRDNDRFVGGNVTVHGNPAYTIGRYAVFEPGTITSDKQPWEGYIQSVAHTLDISSNHATWQTNLGLVRGRVRS